MIPVFLILLPLLTGIVGFFIKEANAAKGWALLSAVLTLVVAVAGIYFYPSAQQSFDAAWLPALGSRFTLSMDGMSKMLVLLTAISFPLIFLATYKNNYKNTGAFYALMMLTQAGLMGVFVANDALLFYFFWELALIPVYFLCSLWGGEKRIAATFKFFIYTFIGSLMMLAGILYVYFQTADHSFAWQSFYSVQMPPAQQSLIFWLFFVAFAIKMPIFPFHTWQPDAYEQSPTATTMVLSGVMVKMGIFAVIKWLLPFFPAAADKYAQVIIILSVVGMLYASLIAIRQDDVKRLIAYSSIAHIGLMSATLFTNSRVGLEGVMIQMFNHGVNVIGLWIVADAIEQQLGTRKFSDLGGLAQKAPALAIMLVVMAFANIALPLTNAFIGEFLMFNGLFSYNIWIAAIAGISIILGAVYTLNMVQKIFYGNTNAATENAVDISGNIKLALVVLVVIIIALGVYPQPMMDLTRDAVGAAMAGK
ncbi:complex I subunit 4 family protein [Sediminibacterium goheungense]|uniref:NADH dehydrogenase subunit M n=1 Tax=Sediminibacterium goheungense TaxID=1086393 RepID=A0A4R6IW15_9BACT|nr:NADH-quinone oxidoreductase subunit M [Sediminibacterium goheungense]TDO26862.1 NADH dehydrogenase subunit M [Sediminibacterium goheungense]